MATRTTGRHVRHTTNETRLETHNAITHPLVSWRAVLAGLLIAFLVDAMLMALGAAIGGISLRDGIQASATSASLMTGAWVIGSALISLFFGSYFAARVGKFSTARIGGAQGLVITALFFAVALFEVGAMSTMLARGAGMAAIGINGAGPANAENPVVNNIIDNSIGDLNLRSSPDVVISGVATRLIQGDQQGAKTYLARQAGITTAEADQRISKAQSQVNTALNDARVATANALQAVGWSLFISLALGSLVSFTGGALGASANFTRPLFVDEPATAHRMVSATI